jgi:hypothetical protein
MKTTLANLLIGGSIVSPKSGKLIQNIHTVEDKWFGTVIGGEVISFDNSKEVRTPRWTTIEIVED